MSKKGMSSKNVRLSNIAIVIAIIAIVCILLNSSIVKTVLITVGVIAVFRYIMKKLDIVKK